MFLKKQVTGLPEYVRILVGQGERPRTPVQVSMKKLKEDADFISKIAIRVCSNSRHESEVFEHIISFCFLLLV